MGIEDEHTDVLQNIECMVASIYRNHTEMTDYNVMRTYEALIDLYTAEHAGRLPRPRDPSTLEQNLFNAIRDTCEWRLGRKHLSNEDSGELRQSPAAIQIGMVATVRNRRWIISGIRHFDGAAGRTHLVEIEYNDGEYPLQEIQRKSSGDAVVMAVSTALV